MDYEQWIGVDLDRTLARGTDSFDPMVIGEPIPLMVALVKRWIAEGKKVKIFTARAYDATPEAIDLIQEWSRTHIGTVLEVTCMKDPGMIAIFDDKGWHVQEDTGLIG